MTLTLIVLYVIAQIAVAAWAARFTGSDEDYLVAGRRLGLFAVAMSLFATWFASETLIATSAEVAKDGLAGARFEPFAYGLGIVVIGLFVAQRLRAEGHLTLAGFLGSRFGKGTERISAIIIAMSGTTWAAAQLFAFATIVASASSLDFSSALIAATLLVLTYTLLGGLLGDVVTDMIQGIIMIIGIVILLFLMINALGGWENAFDGVPKAQWSFSIEGESALDRLEIWLIPIIGSMAAQEAISRTLGARSATIARNGAFLGAGIYILVGLIPICFGLFGPQIAPALGITLGADHAFLPSLAEALFPPWLYIVFSGALLSAILSSVDSALLAVSAVATDTGYRSFRPNPSPRESLLAARVLTVIIGIIAAGLHRSARGCATLFLIPPPSPAC